MPRNDRSLSVRAPDDPRKLLRALEQEAERERGRSEASDTGGVEHQSRADREGAARGRGPAERATAHATSETEGQHPRGRDEGGSAKRTGDAGPRVKGGGLGAPGSGSDGG
jgi:hypothetical protein